MAIHPIERISLPRPDVFFRNHIVPRQPVIITNAFDGQPIAQITTKELAREAFADVALETQLEYSLSLGGKPGKAPARASQPNPKDAELPNRNESGISVMKFREYLDFVDANPTTRMLCTEYAVPARVSAQYTLPPLCKADPRSLEESEILGLPRRWGDHDLVSNMFLANVGNYAHIHHDGDHRQVLLYQVFGRKRVILFQPATGLKLGALDTFAQGFCSTYLQDMSESQKLEFIDKADGYEATLEPGETIYIPMLMWHYIEYVDTGMSVNFRFARNKYGRFLCVDNFHRDYYVQNVGAKMVQGDRYISQIDAIKAAFIRPVPRATKLREMRELFRRICAEICPEAPLEHDSPGEREEQRIARIAAELERGAVYVGDAVAMATSASATGAISGTQHRVLQNRLRELAYPDGVLERILYNSFAKPAVNSLTKTEAALLVRALSSPGAVW